MALPRIEIPPGNGAGGSTATLQVPLVAGGTPGPNGMVTLTPLEAAINLAFDTQDERSTQPQAIDVTAGALTLTAVQHAYRVLRFTGTPGAGLVVITATTDNWWIVSNESGQTITLKGTSGDAGVTIATGKVKIFLRIGGVIVAGPTT